VIHLDLYISDKQVGHTEVDEEEKAVRIGRSQTNKLVLSLPADLSKDSKESMEYHSISKEHCEIFFDLDQWKIRDIRGKLGIKLNNRDLKLEEATLNADDVIQIAFFEIRVSIVQKQKEVTPAQLLESLKSVHPRVKTPTILQMEAVECGAAALAIVLGYYGRFVSLEELRIACGVSRDGSKASNVMKAARKYGLNAKGFKYELKNLFELTYPVILFWNFNHFLVLEGVKKKKVYLNDPAKGPRIVSFEELDISFSGVVLTFEPRTTPSENPDEPVFEKGGIRSDMLNALRQRLIGAESALTYTILCGLMLVIPGLVVPTFSRIFIDEYLISQKTDLIQPLLVGMGITAILRMILTWLQQHFLLRYETKLALSSASRFFDHLLRLPVSYFTQRYAGEIGSRVMLNDNVAKLISEKLATTVIDAVMIVFYAILMLLYDPVLTCACIGIALTNIVVIKYVSKKRIDASQRMLQEMGKLTGTAMGGLKMIETLKATGSEGEFFARWAGYQAKVLRGHQDLEFLRKLIAAIPPLVKMLITTVILAMGGIRVMDGILSVGKLVAFQSLMESFTKPLENLVNFSGSLQELEGDMKRLDDVLRYPQDERYKTDQEYAESLKNLTKLSGTVELKDVTFGYSPLDKPLIENFNLTVRPGERVALVGGSGSGKSTVARLITGLYQIWGGEILFDGVSLNKVPPRLLNNSVGIVDQDIFLFAGTIRDNLAMWDSTILDLNIMSGSRDAAIDEVIQLRPSSYYSSVEEAGTNFSGGQRQRLEIARSLVGFPTILILDEATSALDPTTEKTISDNLRRRGCTCIIVAHRLSTIRDCDEIIVMDKGKIVERGTHEQLLLQDGMYAKLIKE